MTLFDLSCILVIRQKHRFCEIFSGQNQIRSTNDCISHVNIAIDEPTNLTVPDPRFSGIFQFKVHSSLTVDSFPLSSNSSLIDCKASEPSALSAIVPVNIALNLKPDLEIAPEISIVASFPTFSASQRHNASPLQPFSFGILKIPTNVNPKDEKKTFESDVFYRITEFIVRNHRDKNFCRALSIVHGFKTYFGMREGRAEAFFCGY